MSTSKRDLSMSTADPASRKGPETKIGPFPAGIGVAIWINTISTEDGPRKIRSISINPRRYFDRQANEWRDSGSYHPGEIPALIFALQKAQKTSSPPPSRASPRMRNGTPAAAGRRSSRREVPDETVRRRGNTDLGQAAARRNTPRPGASSGRLVTRCRFAPASRSPGSSRG